MVEKGEVKRKGEVPQQQVAGQPRLDPHVNGLGRFQDVEQEVRLLLQDELVPLGPQDLRHVADPLLVEPDPVIAFLPGLLQQGHLPAVNGRDQQVTGDQESQQDQPDSDKRYFDNSGEHFSLCRLSRAGTAFIVITIPC